MALAVALAALVPEAVAMNVTAPVASMLLAVVAVVWSVARLTEIDAPIAAVVPAAVPPDVLVVEPVCVAVAENDPSVCVSSLLPRSAVVVLFAIEIATAALTAVPPVDAAPVSAVVVIVSFDVAFKDSAPARPSPTRYWPRQPACCHQVQP